MVAHDGCFEDLSAVIDVFPFVVFHVPHVEALKWIIYSAVNMCCGIKGLLLIYCFSIKKLPGIYWSEPKSYNKPFVLLCSRDFGFRGQ